MGESDKNNLISAKHLFNTGDLKKSLYILTKLEDIGKISPREKCIVYILKSKIYNFLGQYDKELQSTDLAYQNSRKLGDNLLLIDSLFLKAEKAITMREKEKFFELITEIEKLIKMNPKSLQLNLGNIALYKGLYFSSIEGDLTQALKFYKESLYIFKEKSNKKKLAELYIYIARIMFYKGELDKFLWYHEESLKLNEEIGNKIGISLNYIGFGVFYSFTENLEKSVLFLKKSLKIAEEIECKNIITISLVNIGENLYVQGELKQAGEYYERSLIIYQELQDIEGQGYVLFNIIMLFLDMDSLEKVKHNFSLLEKLFNKHHHNLRKIGEYYIIAKALILKKSTRMRDNAKAEEIFKEFANQERIDFQFTIIAMLNWCELLLNELYLSNDPEILKEIQSIINRLVKIEELQYNFELLAKIYLLQAKLALLQLELKKAQHFLTKAQQIAEQKGLQLLAMKISAEHDELLNQLELWESLNKNQKQISMAERFKYARLHEQMDFMLRKRVTEQQVVHLEKPIFLSIISNNGMPLIKFPFLDDWADQNIFSGFILAFNVFSKELFSKSIDRVKMGDYIILLKSFEPFTACYVIKGPSYLAQQKLTRFSEKVRTTPEIWNQLNEYSKTGEILTTKGNPHLKAIITEIFDL